MHIGSFSHAWVARTLIEEVQQAASTITVITIIVVVIITIALLMIIISITRNHVGSIGVRALI